MLPYDPTMRPKHQCGVAIKKISDLIKSDFFVVGHFEVHTEYDRRDGVIVVLSLVFTQLWVE